MFRIKNVRYGKWIMLALLFLSYFSVNYFQYLLVSFSASFCEDFNITAVQFSAAAFAPTISAGVIGMFGGLLADRFGACRVMAVLGAASAVTAIARLFTGNYILFFFLSMFVGAVFGGGLSVNGKIIRAWFPPDEHGMAFSFLSTGASFGVVCAMFSLSLYKSYRDGLILGAAVIAVTAVLWILIGSDAPEGVEIKKAPNPVKNLPDIIKIKGFWPAVIAGVVYTSLVNVISSQMSGVMVRLHGVTPVEGNGIVSSYAITIIIGAFVIPLYQKKLGTYRPMMIVLLVLAIAVLVPLAFVSFNIIYVLMIFFGFFISVHSGFFSAILTKLPGMEEQYVGSATGLCVLLRYLAGTFMMVSFIATPLIQADARMLFICMGVFIIVMMVCTVLLPEVGKKPGKDNY